MSVYDPWTGYVVPNAWCSLYEYRTGTSTQGYTNSAGLWHAGWFDSGQFNLVVSKANYNDFLNTYGVGGDYIEIPVALIPLGTPPPPPPAQECSILFRAFNEAGTRLAGASVSVDGVSGLTDSLGAVTFYGLILKTYNWAVTLNGYHDAAGQILCNETKLYGVDVTMVSTAEPPPPPPAYYNLVVYVKDSVDGVTPVVGVDVRATEKTMPPLYDGVGTTNSSGAVAFNGLPSGGYRIQAWTKSQSYYDGVDIVLDSNKSVTLHLPTEYSLTINGGQGGSTQPIQGVYAYAKGASATVNAVPDGGYAFDHWVLDGVTYTQNPISFSMNTGHSLTPFFRSLAPQMRYLTISTEKGGHTDPAGGYIQYPQGTSVTVTAIPNSGYTFNSWTLDGVKRTENPITVTMNVDHVLIPFFLGQGQIPIEWVGTIPDFKDGTYEWSLGFNITPIPFLDNYIVDMLAQRPQDESALNSALASQGIAGSATITDKKITKHQNIFGNVDQFTITYTFTLAGTGLNLTGQQALVAWIPILVYVLPIILTLLIAVVYLLIVNSIVSGIKLITGPEGQNIGILVAGGVGIAALVLLSKKERPGEATPKRK